MSTIKAYSLTDAVQAVRAGQRDTARAILDVILQSDRDNTQALLWRAGVSTNAEESVRFLEKLLFLDPGNRQAKDSLEALRARIAKKRPQAEKISQRVWKRNCAVCDAEILAQQVQCPRCGGIDSLSNLQEVVENSLKDESLIVAARSYWEDRLRRGGNAEVHYRLGILCINTLRNSEALYHFEEASRLGNNFPTVEHAIQTLRAQKLILAVDDSPTILNMLRPMIVRNGMRFVEALDGEDGMKVFRRALPDGVILDFQMPIMDGLETCRQIRKERLKNNVPIIMLSGKLLDKLRAKIAGANDYLAKPFEEAVLIRMLRKLLAN